MHKREVCNPIRCNSSRRMRVAVRNWKRPPSVFFIGERIGGDTLYIQAKIDSDLGFSEKTETFI